MKKISTVMIAVFLLIGSFMGSAFAQCGCDKCSQKPPMPMMNGQRPCPCHNPADFAKMMKERQAFLEKKLALTPEQKEKTQVILQNQINELLPLMEQFKAKREELRVLEQTKFNILKVSAKNKKKEAIEKSLTTLRATKRAVMEKYNKQFEAVLTDEQKAKLEEFKKNRPQRPHCPQKGLVPSDRGCGCDSELAK